MYQLVDNLKPIWTIYLFCIFALCSTCYAYDRESAVTYAKTWSEDTGAMDGVANAAVYYKYVGSDGYDCANFISQCLIAGGIKFRSSTAKDDNIRNPIWPLHCLPELGTGYDTRAIKSDLPQYSRTLPAAAQLPLSIMHPYHNSGYSKTPYTSPSLQDNGPMWNDVTIGDVLCIWYDSNYHHVMLITDVDKQSNPHDLCYTAHSSWQLNKSANERWANWKISGDVRVICLWDAPLVRDFAIYSGSNRIKWKWKDRWCLAQYQQMANNLDLILRVTFDTNMDVSQMPAIKLQLDGVDYTFLSWPTGDGINNKGWWINADSGSFKQYRTWKGRIPAGNLPLGKHGLGAISINAFADDGSGIDENNELASYLAGSMNRLNIMVDTRGSNGIGK
jgi:hypothetical protein